ncbi:hypothetical protein [Rubinisphaera margarita]|uniref:hypothetical protein n=1 Tax=Rubinisphaera margarita TaxID=2909586 RepID=UPI001EE8DE1D|nr:hypothetical protein [Rubinisphaera margarita]MCG6158315.1 hypothetical protein [Rubinisphaera margarita]
MSDNTNFPEYRNNPALILALLVSVILNIAFLRDIWRSRAELRMYENYPELLQRR